MEFRAGAIFSHPSQPLSADPGGLERVTPSPSHPQNCLALVISLSPVCRQSPVLGGEEQGSGEGRPSPQAPGHPGEASFNRKKKKSILIVRCYFL